jgi:hypothetical protein
MKALLEFPALVERYVTDERTEMKLARNDRKTLG